MKKNIVLLFLSLAAIPLSYGLATPNDHQGGPPKSHSPDHTESQQASYEAWLKAQQAKWDLSHSSTGNKMVRKVKKNDEITFARWLQLRGGLEPGEQFHYIEVYTQYEKVAEKMRREDDGWGTSFEQWLKNRGGIKKSEVGHPDDVINEYEEEMKKQREYENSPPSIEGWLKDKGENEWKPSFEEWLSNRGGKKEGEWYYQLYPQYEKELEQMKMWKRDDVIGFEEWLNNRGGKKEGEWYYQLYPQYEKELAQTKSWKRDDRISFEQWMKNRGGKKEGEWYYRLYPQYEREEGPDPRTNVTAETDRLLWETNIYAFDAIRKLQEPIEEPVGPDSIDWRSDACTGLIDRPFANDFKKACQRNDFALANLVHQHRWTECVREKVSKLFKEDMEEICRDETGSKFFCKTAIVFYSWAERVFWGPPVKPCNPDGT